MKSIYPVVVGLTLMLLGTQSAWALPQFAVRSVRACDTCHVAPTGWVDPDVALRKCTLSCGGCHISPSGGGMRTASGLYYGRVTLPRWGAMKPAGQISMSGQFGDKAKKVPSSQPTYLPIHPTTNSEAGLTDWSPHSQPTSQPSTPSSQPMAEEPSSQPMAEEPSSQPMAEEPSSQPMAEEPSSQPMAEEPSSQPMAEEPSSQPMAEEPSSQPMAGEPSSQPMAEEPSSQAVAIKKKTAKKRSMVPAPGTAGRYGGIEVNPDYQIGADLRFAYFKPLDESQDAAFFPMQTDLYFAVRPYNPDQINKGRVTLLVNGGSQGSRGEAFDNSLDRMFVREWFAMYHDLPDQIYLRAGRFLPAHGWKTDDHTGFIRQGQQIMGQGFDHERQVTGVEFGWNPNYPYVHVSVFNAADQWEKPFDADDGFGTSISAGWRDLAWHLGTSLLYGNRNDPAGEAFDQFAASLQWALNLWVVAKLPLIYMGEYHLNSQWPKAEESSHGLSAFHELGWLITKGFNTTLRYDWSDPNIDYAYDSRHRINVGFEFYPVQFLEIVARYRHNWTNSEDRFEVESDEVLLMLHGWY